MSNKAQDRKALREIHGGERVPALKEQQLSESRDDRAERVRRAQAAIARKRERK